MKKILLLMVMLLSVQPSHSQFFKNLYEDFLKYGTVYVAGDIKNSYESSRKEYFVERPEEGDLYGIPKVIDVTEYYPFDYRYGIGIRKLGRFQYERKPGNFWTGNANKESVQALSAPTSAVEGFEYLFHFEKERLRGEIWNNHRYFLRHTGDYHIAKIESRKQGAFDFEYNSAELRARLPIGNKFSLSAGAIYRTHTKAYGYNPIEIWLNETAVDSQGREYPLHPWYSLGFQYGYTDHYTTYTDNVTGNETTDWIWKNENGKTVAYSDLDFRNTIFRDLINVFNNDEWDKLAAFGVVSPIIGADLYHYKNNFWLHAYGNYLPSYHKYITGDEDFSYLNRNNWGKGGLIEDAELEQWTDYQAGVNLGWKIGKNFGIFVEGEYNKMWSTKFFNTTFGINYTFR